LRIDGGHGFDTDALHRALGLVVRWVEERTIPGAGVWIGRAGERVAEAYVGVADALSAQAVTRDTVWSVASVTKPFTAAVVMRAVQLGLVTLDEPIIQWVPEFASDPQHSHDDADSRPAPVIGIERLREQVSLRHCLSHSSGLPGFGVENLDLRKALRPLPDFVAAFAAAPLFFAPGTAHLYSNCGILMAAEVAGRALGGGPGPDGTGIDAFRSEFVALLADVGMKSSALQPPTSWAERIAMVTDTGQVDEAYEMANSSYYRSLGIPWGGLFSTPRDLGRWLRTFLDAPTALSSALSVGAVRQMVAINASGPDTDAVVPIGLRDGAAEGLHRARVEWGLGWEVKGGKHRHPSGDLTSPRTISHLGATGTMVWLDRDTGVQVVLLTNRTLASGWTRDRPRMALFSNAVMGALSR
jgi:beta-lactamase class C